MTTLDASRPVPPPSGDRVAGQPAPVGSSFYLGLRILPREQRLAMYSVYAFCRAVDDVADEGGAADVRLAQLALWNEAIEGLYSSRRPDGPLASLHDAIRRFSLAKADFAAIVAGMAMDVRGETVRPSDAAFDLYCDRVACAPGRLSVRVFGLADAVGHDLARHLGRALQITNILRDIDEDAAMGRLYLPRELLENAGIADLPAERLLADPRLADACAVLVARARRHFTEADGIMDACPRASVRAPRLMSAAYRPLLERLDGRGWSEPRRKVPKRKRDLAGAVLRFGIL